MRSISHLVGWCFLRAYTVDKMITLHKKSKGQTTRLSLNPFLVHT